MNDRLRTLVRQAGFSFKYKTAPDELNPGHKLQDLEKFAELIVRECAKSANDWYQNHNEIHWDPATYILANFGVEDVSN